MRGLFPVAASRGHSSSQCAGLSLSQPLLLRSTGSRRAGSVIVAHGPSCSVACGIFPDQGSNPCPPRWQADSQPLRHQRSPWTFKLIMTLRHSRTTEGVTAILSTHQFSRLSTHPQAPDLPESLANCVRMVLFVTQKMTPYIRGKVLNIWKRLSRMRGMETWGSLMGSSQEGFVVWFEVL